MTGIHLINHSKDGVTIQFYMMLICALLQLKLKQDVLLQEDQDQKELTDKDSDKKMEETNPSELMRDFEEKESVLSSGSNNEGESILEKSLPDLETQPSASTDPRVVAKHDTKSSIAISHRYQFFEMIGKNLRKYWKIGIHWLNTLRKILNRPFDQHAIKLLRGG